MLPAASGTVEWLGLHSLRQFLHGLLRADIRENFTISEFAPLLLHCMEGTKERQLLLNFRISDTQFGGRFPTENQAACADGGEASGCTAKRRPIAFRMAVKLLRAGLPFGDSVR